MSISSRSALDMLSTCAPRAWCKRLVSWEVFNDSLHLFAERGEIVRYRMAQQILHEAGFNSASSEKEIAEFVATEDDEIAVPVKAAAAAANPYDEIETYRHDWYEPCSQLPLPFGLLPASTVDWEQGTLSAELVHGLVPDEWLSYPEELFECGRGETVKVSLSGLSFELSAIEMLVPTASAPNLDAAPAVSLASRRVGRPRQWNWDAALAHVTAVAAEGKIPTGHGAQARLEELIAEYFTSQFGAEPATSEIRKRASTIIQALQGRKSDSGDSG
jgi:hypothetical protein